MLEEMSKELQRMRLGRGLQVDVDVYLERGAAIFVERGSRSEEDFEVMLGEEVAAYGVLGRLINDASRWCLMEFTHFFLALTFAHQESYDHSVGFPVDVLGLKQRTNLWYEREHWWMVLQSHFDTLVV